MDEKHIESKKREKWKFLPEPRSGSRSRWRPRSGLIVDPRSREAALFKACMGARWGPRSGLVVECGFEEPRSGSGAVRDREKYNKKTWWNPQFKMSYSENKYARFDQLSVGSGSDQTGSYCGTTESLESPELRQPESWAHTCVNVKFQSRQNDLSNVPIVPRVTKKSNSRTLEDIAKDFTLENLPARRAFLPLARFSRALQRNDKKYFCVIFCVITMRFMKWRGNATVRSKRFSSWKFCASGSATIGGIKPDLA